MHLRKIKYNPYEIFKRSATPPGLYARLKLIRIVSSQNNDGTWGSTDKEWQTFLVIHALRNKGILGCRTLRIKIKVDLYPIHDVFYGRRYVDLSEKMEKAILSAQNYFMHR